MEPIPVQTVSELGGPQTDDEAQAQLRETLQRMLAALDNPVLDEPC
jgi:hypothetical protein